MGMLVTASNNPFMLKSFRGVERSCYEQGYSLILCNTEGDYERMDTSLETLATKKRVDGLLLLMCTEARAPIKKCIKSLSTVTYGDDGLVSI